MKVAVFFCSVLKSTFFFGYHKVDSSGHIEKNGLEDV